MNYFPLPPEVAKIPLDDYTGVLDFSGGVESIALMAWLKDKGEKIVAVNFAISSPEPPYGPIEEWLAKQRINAQKIAEKFAVPLMEIDLQMINFGTLRNEKPEQLLTSSGSAKTFFLFLRRNGVDIGFSTRGHTVNSNNHLDDVDLSFNIDLGAGEYIEIIAAKSEAGIQLKAQVAAAPHPGILSSVLSINFIAPLPEPRPIAP